MWASFGEPHDIRQARKNGVDAAFHIANAFAMNDADFENASGTAFGEVFGDQIAQILRTKGVQIEHPVNGQRLWIRTFVRHNEELPQQA
jgi:hypothetical protein